MLGAIPAVLLLAPPARDAAAGPSSSDDVDAADDAPDAVAQRRAAGARRLVQPAATHELILRAIDAIKVVRGRAQRPLPHVRQPDARAARHGDPGGERVPPRHAERGAELFLLFSGADTAVKARLATRKVLPGLQLLAAPDEFAPILKVLRTIKHLCMGEARHMDELWRAKAIPTCAPRRGHHLPDSAWAPPTARDAQPVRQRALPTCQINAAPGGGRRRRRAAHPPEHHRGRLAAQAVRAADHVRHRQGRARAELKQHSGVQFYLGLLSTSYWQEAALDALLVWLNDELAHVERYMKTAHGVGQLSVVMEARSNVAFVNMLDALSKIVYTSTNRALGKIDPNLGHSCACCSRASRTARVRPLLLKVLTSLYERHQSPKQLVKLRSALLEGIQHSDPGVLVKKVASELYEAFKTHDIL